MTQFEEFQELLKTKPRRWLVTGVAGFIGSNILETLLDLGQQVIGIDNFSTGHKKNLEQVRELVGGGKWKKFDFTEGDIADLSVCREASRGVEIILHQAALGSVPRSIEDPVATNRSNVDGFLNMLVAANETKTERFVYAASSSTYGDHPGLPKVESVTGSPLSPYAVTKLVNELYADVFTRVYGLNTIGLRYFNVFGPRQDPAGAYAAVIPRWISSMLSAAPAVIYGDGETSRDFCYIDNVVQANILAAITETEASVNQVYNIAVGERTTLNDLHSLLREGITRRGHTLDIPYPEYRDFRPGDVRHSLASVEKAKTLLGYSPTHSLGSGLDESLDWYATNL